MAAATFDVCETLLADPWPGAFRDARVERTHGWLREHGCERSRSTVADAYAATKRTYHERWNADRIYPVREAVADLLGLLDAPAYPQETVESLVRLFEDPEPELRMVPVDGALEALLALRAAGVKLGVVSDVGYTPGRVILRFLESAGLAELLEAGALLFSDELGAYKRDPAVFRLALGALGAAPASAVHVGDLKRTDVAGARAAGVATVRFRGCVDDPSTEPEADYVVDDLRELPPLLASLPASRGASSSSKKRSRPSAIRA